ncbi:hypothetical protein QS713_06970 [Gleimia hominis]|uniref:Colicin transporter n=1 Tax=Gleimia hominis TaxID=595468 RepID=A0ABU3IBP3_9ACTO|nr:hypothetical protein [Gleimia hominis]MDT3767800.1 hypothetical protein [Gleimia hominis]
MNTVQSPNPTEQDAGKPKRKRNIIIASAAGLALLALATGGGAWAYTTSQANTLKEAQTKCTQTLADYQGAKTKASETIKTATSKNLDKQVKALKEAVETPVDHKCTATSVKSVRKATERLSGQNARIKAETTAVQTAVLKEEHTTSVKNLENTLKDAQHLLNQVKNQEGDKNVKALKDAVNKAKNTVKAQKDATPSETSVKTLKDARQNLQAAMKNTHPKTGNKGEGGQSGTNGSGNNGSAQGQGANGPAPSNPNNQGYANNSQGYANGSQGYSGNRGYNHSGNRGYNTPQYQQPQYKPAPKPQSNQGNGPASRDEAWKYVHNLGKNNNGGSQKVPHGWTETSHDICSVCDTNDNCRDVPCN